MTNFANINAKPGLNEGYLYNPYQAQDKSGAYYDGEIPVEYLNRVFGAHDKATDMINATNDTKLQKFFQWLADEGKLPQ